MKFLLMILVIFEFAMMINAQKEKTLIADGTNNVPLKYQLQPKVEQLSATEIETIRNEALRTEIDFNVLPQASSEEMLLKQDFQLLDVAKGWFISREIEYKAYLYTAWSEKIKRNYQGIIILRNFENNTKFAVMAHYAYQYRGDKYIRQLPDINSNILSEIAIFSEPPAKKISRRTVRIIEFSPTMLEKLGFAEIQRREDQKQRSPWNPDAVKPIKRIYTPPIVTASKIFAETNLGKSPIFFSQNFKQNGDNWQETQAISKIDLQPDHTIYLEIVKPIFPKGLGEK